MTFEISFQTKYLFTSLINGLILLSTSVQAQDGILIDYVGSTRENSAILDVRSSNQGVLVPRLTTAQRNAITLPANGLLLFQTDGISGYHYNSGTPVAPIWTRLFEGTGNNNTTGGGTQNYVTKWNNAAGTTIGNSQIFDNGTSVGVGLALPSFKLHVDGDFHAAGKIVVQNSANGGGSRGLWMWNAADSNWGIYMGQAGAGLSLSNGTAVGGGGFTSHAIRTRVNNSNTNGIIFENSAESLLFSVRGSDGQSYHRGNVGINTDPSARLHILVDNDQNGNPANNGIYVQNNDVSGDNGDAIIATRVAGSGGGDPFFSMDVNGVTGWSMGLDNSDADKLKFANSWNDPGTNARMTIQTDGNVGIGTTAPSYLLDVNGNTRVNAGLFTQGTASTLYGTNASIYANNGNVSGGGIMISDDGGFFDYNNGPVTFNGSTGLTIAGNNGVNSSNAYLQVRQLGGSGNRPVYASSNGTLIVSDKGIARAKTWGTTGYNNNDDWRAVTDWTNAISVSSGDVIKFDVSFMTRLTNGSGNDDYYYYIEFTGCAGGNVLGTSAWYRPSEDGSDHDNMKQIAFSNYWDCNCNGNMQWRLWVQNTGDDNWEIANRVLIATKY